MSDDPRGFRRGQVGERDDPPRQGHGGSGRAPAGDRFEDYRQSDFPASSPSRKQPDKQPSFSAFRPEAYAKNETSPSSQPERSDWDDASRNVLPSPPRNAPPPPQDPYYQNASSDPYAPRSARGYPPNWDRDPYQDAGANQFPSYYPAEEDLGGPDAQSVHDRFFANQADEAPPPGGAYREPREPHPRAPRDPFADRGFDAGAPQGFENEGAHRFDGRQVQSYNSDLEPRGGDFGADFGSEQFYGWEKDDQAPPPQALRAAPPPAAMADDDDDDLDADFFEDEDDYDIDDYDQGRGGGRKRLVAVVLIGAVAVGGGLAYVYKSTGSGGSGPSVITADSSPIKQEPNDAGGREFPNRNKAIYDRLIDDGSGSEQQVANAASESAGREIPGIVTTGTLEERINNALKEEERSASQDNGGAPAEANTADAPRTVRTVTFDPDGTQRTAAASAQDGSISPGIVVSSQPTAAPASAPEAEPTPPAGTQQVAAVSPQPQAPQVSEGPSGGGFFVQIAARNDQDAAVAAFATLQQKYAAVIGSYSPSVRKVDLGTKGVWYRLLVGPVSTKPEADALCEQLKSAGMKSCFSRKDG